MLIRVRCCSPTATVRPAPSPAHRALQPSTIRSASCRRATAFQIPPFSTLFRARPSATLRLAAPFRFRAPQRRQPTPHSARSSAHRDCRRLVPVSPTTICSSRAAACCVTFPISIFARSAAAFAAALAPAVLKARCCCRVWSVTTRRFLLVTNFRRRRKFSSRANMSTSLPIRRRPSRSRFRWAARHRPSSSTTRI